MGYVLYYVINSVTIAVRETSHCYYYMILFTIWTILVAPLGLSFLFFCTLKWRHLPSIVICYQQQQHYLFCLSFVHSLNYLTTRWASTTSLSCTLSNREYHNFIMNLLDNGVWPFKIWFGLRLRFNTFHVTFQVLQMSLKLYAQKTTKLEFWMHIDAYNFAIESYHKRSIFDV